MRVCVCVDTCARMYERVCTRVCVCVSMYARVCVCDCSVSTCSHVQPQVYVSAEAGSSDCGPCLGLASHAELEGKGGC